MKTSLQVIVVEDSDLDAELIAKSLESEGFDLQLWRVQTARELENALNVQSWDVVISDFSLPQLSGLEALRIVRENAADVPFIMVSGTIGEDIAVQVIRNGADDYLLKDRLGRLGHSVERAIELRRSKARRAEELRESERRFRDMLENVDLIAFTLDISGCVTFCNDYLLRLTGWQRAEVVGRDWFHRFIPVGDRVVQVFFDTIRQGTIPAHYENPILTRDGRLRDVQWNNTILRDPKGSVIGVASIGADVTDQKKNEEAKAALALRNESFVKALGEIVYDHDLISNHIEWGGNPERLTGWTAPELGITEEEWQEKIHHDDLERAC
jgi:PAS domain S-box-containing protein